MFLKCFLSLFIEFCLGFLKLNMLNQLVYCVPIGFDESNLTSVYNEKRNHVATYLTTLFQKVKGKTISADYFFSVINFFSMFLTDFIATTIADTYAPELPTTSIPTAVTLDNTIADESHFFSRSFADDTVINRTIFCTPYCPQSRRIRSLSGPMSTPN